MYSQEEYLKMMKADLLVGSVKIDLESFSSLTYPFEIQFD